MAAKQSERIKLWGIVQGVGFRPYVAKMAEAFNMKGTVLNIGGLVEITVTDTPKRISAFLDALIENKPGPSEIVHVKRETVDYREFDSFTIIASDAGGDEAAMIPADLAICPSCLEELYNEKNPRHQHPFISCMVCGPRYTIIDRIPYDRCNTSMIDFPMCDFCEGEYTNLHDRRYHAQTISCHECGPSLLWKSAAEAISHITSAPLQYDDITKEYHNQYLQQHLPDNNNMSHIKNDQVLLDHAAKVLRNGGVLLFKSVGGYNLIADPLNDKAVAKLRHIKNREAKPFAVMFRNPAQIRDFCHMNEVEEKLLSSSARPILLLEHKLGSYTVAGETVDSCETVCNTLSSVRTADFNELTRSRFIGSFLPSFAAQYMLLDRISPLIFTSANLSDMPMICDDDEASEMLEKHPEIDGMIYNLRNIRVRVDDSVARVIDGQPQMIRRSKGYAPVPLFVNVEQENCVSSADASAIPQIFATGSQLKNSFALTKDNFVYISQFFGDMDTIENQKIYEENLERLKNLFRIKPEKVVCDMHPMYFTTRFAEEYAQANNLPLIKVQHHHAHVASVMAENDLKGKVIGVSFDGTGYGTDGNIWGGEFFICEGSDAKRIAHLRYTDMIGGDSSVKDAVRSALSYIYAYENDNMPPAEQKTFSNTDKNTDSFSCVSDSTVSIIPDISDIIEYGKKRLYDKPEAKLVSSALKSGINTVKSSSMGRLFDAVSALLDICDYNNYEGQCAIMLEDAAAFAQKHPGEKRNCDLALSFHERIIDMIVDQCRNARSKYGAEQVALTGGTFQNRILMEGVLDKLRADGFKPYYNISVSPNDGGIALGQAYVAMHST